MPCSFIKEDAICIICDTFCSSSNFLNVGVSIPGWEFEFVGVVGHCADLRTAAPTSLTFIEGLLTEGVPKAGAPKSKLLGAD